jgi:formylglycine-generating enzyme required for sulfatase activity
MPVKASAPMETAQRTAAAPVAQPQHAAGIPSAAPRTAPQAQPEPSTVQNGAQPTTSGGADPLVGIQLGDYRVQQLLGSGMWGATYLAIQLSVNRPVGLKVLDLSSAQDDSARAHFLADARAKAAVQHPFIVSVFEADERNGLVFYTHEYLDGATLQDLVDQGQQIDEKTALHILKAAGEGLNYLWSHNLAHSPIDAKSIRMGKDGIARLANLALSQADAAVTPEYEIQTVSNFVSELIPATSQSPGMRALLIRMAGGANPITSWPVVLQAVKALEPKVVPVEAAKIKAADQAAQRAMEAARKAQKRALVIQLCTLAALLGVVGFFIVKFLVSNKRNLTQKEDVPAGTYIVGPPSDQKTIDLGAFDIDKYEVTIGDYAEFIEFCKASPENEHKYDHERGARHLLHSNDNVIKLIGNAKNGNNVFKSDNDPGAKVDLNCPMVGVTFWDAWAYAKWKGRDLPTEEEWEAAARGTKGNKYPWGDELELKRFNSNDGYEAMKPGKSTDDGYNYWAPVDTFSSDESPFKVMGMAGNVAEWVYRKEGAREVPVVKGGSFATPPLTMFERLTSIAAEDGLFVFPTSMKKKNGPNISEVEFAGDPIVPTTKTLYIGFRTVRRK